MSTTAQLAADAFLTEVFGDADTYTVSDGVMQGFSLQDFVAHCTISPMRTRAVGSLKILGQLLDSCMEKRGKWEEIAFVDPATEGTQFVRTLKVASCLGGEHGVHKPSCPHYCSTKHHESNPFRNRFARPPRHRPIALQTSIL